MQAMRLPFFSRGALGSSAGDVVPVVGGDALQPADRHRLLLDPAAAAGRLAGPVADAAQDAREHIGLAVHHVGLGELALGDQADVFGNIGVRRTGPLAIHDPMKIIRFRSIGRLHDPSY
jgi:hypothetical protein